MDERLVSSAHASSDDVAHATLSRSVSRVHRFRSIARQQKYVFVDPLTLVNVLKIQFALFENSAHFRKLSGCNVRHSQPKISADSFDLVNGFEKSCSEVSRAPKFGRSSQACPIQRRRVARSKH